MACARTARAVRVAGLKPSQIRPLRPRDYHSASYSTPPPFNAAESAILSSALLHVPRHGFSLTALSQGAVDAGYREASTNLFPRGPFDLVNYHVVTQRLRLKDGIQFPDEKVGVGSRVRSLVLQRLRGNAEVIGKWQEALALMALPSNVSASLAELATLSDEIWFLSGETSVDFSWYTKRASLSAIYSSTELYMTTDASQHFIETETFLDRRLEDLRAVTSTVDAVGKWTNFTAQAAINVARSKGVRI